MDKTFKFRYVNEITGVFVLLAVAALIAGVFFAGRAQGLFKPKFRLYSVFTSDEGAFGLREGAEVKVREATAGTVKNIQPQPDGTLQATFELQESFHGFIRTNSVAVIKKTLLVAGDAYVAISVGDRRYPVIPAESYIESRKDTEIIAQVMGLLDEIRAQALPILDQFQIFMNELPGVTIQARKTLRQGEILMRNDLPALTQQAQDTLRQLQVLIEGLQRHWLVRKYIEPSDTGLMIAPASVGAPAPAAPATSQPGGQPP